MSPFVRFTMKFRVVSIITLCLAVLLLGFLAVSGYAARAILYGDRAASALITDNQTTLALVDSINHLRSVRSVLAVSLASVQAKEGEQAQQQLQRARNKFQQSLEASVHYQQATDKGTAEQALQAALQTTYQHYIDHSIRPMMDAVAKGDAVRYNQLLAGAAAADDEAYEHVLDQALACRQQANGLLIGDTHRHADASFRLQTVGAVLLLLVALLIRWVLVRTVARPLRQAQELANSVASGGLGHAVEVIEHSHNEVNHLLHSLSVMDARLVAIVQQVRSSSVEISEASAQISRGNDDLSQRTQSQAASLEETAATIEEMTANLRQHASHTRHANSLMGTSRDLAAQGDKTSRESMDAIQALASSSRRIAEIVGMMDEIAFQTNILALNAAVEAARAGEQGRSFAVVASEVRALAQRSATAARQVRELIAEGTHHVDSCEQLTRSSRDGLSSIFDSVSQMTGIFAEVAAATEEQSEAIGQVNQAVLRMDDNTQQNAALVEEASAAARALHEQALRLVDQVAFFKIA
ncbi:methyl-accepting chemotaxis protein [Frateuria aurantia]